MKNLLDQGKVRNYLYFFITLTTLTAVSIFFGNLFETRRLAWGIISFTVGLIGLILESVPVLNGSVYVSKQELKAMTVFSSIITFLVLLNLAPDLLLKAILVPITGLN